MDFLEKDLERIIFETENEELQKRGFYIDGKKFRQLRIGNYGIADLVTIKRHTTSCDGFTTQSVFVTIYELKLDKIGISAFLQAVGYAKGIQEYCIERFPTIEIIVNIILCGKSIDNSGSFCYIPSIFRNIRYYVYEYTLNGLYFKRSDSYYLKNKGF